MKLPLPALRHLVLLAYLLVPARAAAEDQLAPRIKQLIDGDRYRTAHWGLLVVDVKTGETIYTHHAEKLFAPASTTKLFSVATALDALGADHRFETPVYARGEIEAESGLLRGDLILRASGDLTMGGRTTESGEIEFTSSDHTYASGGAETGLTKADPLAGLNELAKQVAASGIKKIEGQILVDDNLFVDAESSGSGPSRVSPILINDNVLDIIYEPGEKSGEPGKVTVRPECKLFEIEARLETIAGDGKLETYVRAPAAGKLIISGKIPAGHKPVVRIYEVPDPPKFAAACFREALERVGVSVTASKTDAPLPAAEDYPKLKQVALLKSLPFAENAKLVLKVSHNLHASTLPCLVAVEHGERTVWQGLKRERAFLEKAGLAVDTISFGGGAGGARADYVTPAATVALLRYMSTREDFPVYEKALPIMGVDGTLAKTVGKSSIAREKVQAKTGTLYWNNGLDDSTLLTSKALAGYLTTKQDRRCAFAMFVNGVPLRGGLTANSIGADLGKLCEIIIEER